MSIKNKIAGVSIVILFFAMGINTVVTTRYFTREYLAVKQSEISVVNETIKSQLDRLLQMHIPLDQLVGFEVMCREAVAKHQGLSYAMVINPEGKILFHNDPSFHNKILKQDWAVTPNTLQAWETGTTYIEGEDYYDFILPVYDSRGKIIASIRTGFPKEHITSKSWKLIGYSATTTVISFAVGCLLLITLLYHWVSKPVAGFIETIGDIRKQGATDSKRLVEITSKDEIGNMSSAFNQMLEELRQTTVSKQYLDYILENMLNSLIITDNEYRVRTVNQETLNLLDYSREEITGKSLSEILEVPIEKVIDKSQTNPSVKAIESNYSDKRGNHTPVLFSSSVIRDESNEIEGYICVAQNITEIKTLRGFLPICSSCKKIRDDKGYWSQVEQYISEHSKAQFSHSICPDCVETLYPGFNMSIKNTSETRDKV